MKNVFYAFVLLAAAYSCVPCEKEQFIEDSNSVSGRTVINTSIESDLTKTSLNGSDAEGYQVLWSKGDRIKVIGQDGFDKYYTLDGDGGSTKGTFIGDPIPDGDKFRAFYSVDNMVFPATQVFLEGKIANSPMYAEFKVTDGKASEASFWNLCGLLKINIRSSECKNVRSIAVSSDQLMAGQMIVSFKQMLISDWPAPGSKSVTLDCGEQGVALSAYGTDFYIALPANEYTGVNIEIKYTDGTSETKTLKSKKVLRITRAKITQVSFKKIQEGALEGVFTVSSNGKKVLFSKGNLKYDVSKAEWGFFDEQNHFISEGKGDIASESVISHFTWGLGDWSTAPHTTTYENGTFGDWGEAIDDKGTWRTLTKDEWEYLVNNSLNRFITINGLTGCIIAPDRFLTNYVFDQLKESYSLNEWAQAEAAGFIFLPQDGLREGDRVALYSGGSYWSSSSSEGNHSWYMDFGSYYVTFNNVYSRSYGMSVRLVTEVR